MKLKSPSAQRMGEGKFQMVMVRIECFNRVLQMNAPCPEGAPAYRQAGTIHENSPGVLVRVTVTKPVSFRVGRLRKFLKTKNVTE
jgi:hypothetical protein